MAIERTLIQGFLSLFDKLSNIPGYHKGGTVFGKANYICDAKLEMTRALSNCNFKFK